MKDNGGLILAGLVLVGVLGYSVMQQPTTPVPPPDDPCPDCPKPKRPTPPVPPTPQPPEPSPKPKPKPRPWEESGPAVAGKASVGGRTSPDGTEIDCDLPGDLHKKNIAAKGLGCCVFRSIDHAAQWANLPQLYGMPEWMVSKGIEGGGYPGKVDKLIPQICKDRNMPVPEYIQVEGKDLAALKLASKTGRMISVTYSKSPTGRYNGGQIAHMVNAAHFSDKWVAILDNNYIGENAYEWMTPEEFMKVCNPGSLWAVIFLEPGPPPAPK